ncbi:hypothetical protein CLAFUW4_02134 [Fulvia fulva]|uniref:uncharacterized protein n=1 Tax=Passalora fulva TaxID=5499 RepID=UPI0028529A2C|nr:uncharacterized protein CLAFUR5_20138 [Fulvia fulva]KAK4634916.1 hypothetical protein CLAFUR4_02130 [Fulvia fulva]KAK4637002.1 hypothetical protein CLAFUR0_02133 [Fulvia fulva]WMI38776.1 hypothetical protein CLAFUR5_20138 [Fulvia fulva]WPV08730.1 hypothetical protein CLAFUW4_02134 [Fulvia fulva]WPV23675.1 hypothetical protein CLAFUW7_02134 [Fulvia fulva]
MEVLDGLSQLLSPLLDPPLRAQIQAIDLTSLSRISLSRLTKTALPNLGRVELVSGPAYEEHYDELYRTNFHGGERECSELIVARLIDDAQYKRKGLSPFRILGLRDPAGRAIGAAHFSVLFLTKSGYAVPYLQYIYIRPENRRQDLSELLHTLVLAVTMALAAKRANTDAIAVPFTLCETEPTVPSEDTAKQGHAVDRSKIHSKSGSQALMLRRKYDGRVVSAHVQPGMEMGEPPLTYIWVLRANPAVELAFEDGDLGKSLIDAYYQSLVDEGFPQENIAQAMRLAEARRDGDAEFCLLPLSAITRDMYIDIDDNS